jgi:hypothetical protein
MTKAGLEGFIESGKFRLTKWYLDAVAEDGTAFIGYAAGLRLGAVQVRYRATLVAPPEEASDERYTLRSSPDPLIDNDGLVRWDCPPLQVTGEWLPRCASIQRKLFASEAGEVLWECIAPSAAVILALPSRQITGSGYVERLTLTAPPWTLGLDELHWGRFIANDGYVVWIDWRGPKPRRLVLLNGDEVQNAIVCEECIQLTGPGARLEFMTHDISGSSRILREGPLAKIISAVPGLANILPRWLGQGHELKRLSRARLAFHDAPARDGWAIHEVVTWH